MLKRLTSLRIPHKHQLICTKNINLLYHNKYNKSTSPEQSLGKLFGAPKEINTQVINTLTEDTLTRNDFGFYQKLLPIDTMQDIINAINHTFEIPYWYIVLSLPFITKLFITIPAQITCNRIYESRLPLLPIAMYETNLEVLNQRRRQRDVPAIKKKRNEIQNKYGFLPIHAQMYPFLPGLIQIPIHLTMYVAINTMYSSYPLWNKGGFIMGNGWTFTDLSMSDNTYILPISIGITMSMLQIIFNNKNKTRNIGFNASKFKMVSISGVGLMTYLSINWTIGFNLYILSNLSSYIMQQILMDNNGFRRLIGLNQISEMENDYKKVQIVQETMKQSIVKVVENKRNIDENKSVEQIVFGILGNKDNYNKLNVEQKHIDSLMDDISNVNVVSKEGQWYQSGDEEETVNEDEYIQYSDNDDDFDDDGGGYQKVKIHEEEK